MTARNLIPAAPFLAGLLSLGLPACLLTGIEPDEIDVADEGTEDGITTGVSSEDGNDDEAGDGDGDPGGDGDGDGDPTTGDGDGDPTTGDGDGDTGGDGDGDPSTTGDGDGDGDLTDCSGFAPTDVSEGPNPVAVLDGASALASTCGGAGPETVYRFTAPAGGEWQFVIEQPEFTEVLALVDSCDPLQELVCSAAPASVTQVLEQDQVVFVIVDSEAGTGSATLTISLL